MRKWTWIVAVTLAACSGGDKNPTGVVIGPVTTVNISVVTSTMIVGATQQLSARLYDKKGNLVTTSSATWSAAPAAVATISQAGLLTAVTPGTARVTATSGSVSATVDVLVHADPCATPIALGVGEVRNFTGGSSVSCITLAATSGASDYVVIGSNTRPAQDDVLQYSVSLQSVAPALATLPSLTAPSVQAELDPRLILEAQEARRTDALHERLRGYEQARIAPVLPTVARNRRAATLATQSSSAVTPSITPAVALAVAAVGDTVTVRVPNLNVGKDICKDYIPVRAVVRTLSARSLILEDVTTPAGGFTTGDYGAVAQEFDNLIFPADTAWFGAPTDINTDGRITMLFTPEVNRLTPAGSTGFTAGFFFGSDLIKKSEYPTTNDCRNQTNEQEIFYLLTPDPTGSFNNVRTTATVRQGTRGVIAHEFQHMINQGVRQYNPAVQALETFWLNEGMSHLAEEIVGRALLRVGDFQSLAYAQINPSPSAADDYNAFFRQNLSRFQRWMVRPDTSAPVSAKNRDQLAPRGASWALLRYAIDQYSNGAARAFTRALAAGPQTDVTNLLARTPGVTFDQIITGWLVANYADGLPINGLAPRFSYLSWNIRDVMSGVNAGAFPLLVTPFPGAFTTQTLSSSGNYYRLARTASSPQVQLKLVAPGGATLSSEYSTVTILRAQ